MEPTIISLLVQVPLVGVFIWFTLRLTREHRQEADVRDQRWIVFLEAERTQRRDAMSLGMNQIKETNGYISRLTENIADLSAAMGNHDMNAQVRHQEIKAAVEKINNGQPKR